MRIAPLVKILLMLLPLIEIAGFIMIGKIIGVGWTLLLIIATTLIGAMILRTQGIASLNRVYQRMQGGEHPALEVMEGSLVMFAGFLLLLPGFVTDTVGLLLLIPMLRRSCVRWMLAKGMVETPKKQPKKSPHVIEGEFWRDDDDRKD